MEDIMNCILFGKMFVVPKSCVKADVHSVWMPNICFSL